MTTNRRHFLKTILAGSVAATVPVSFQGCVSKEETLTILHTNDVHSHIQPFPANHSKYPNMGGFARRMTLIKKIRAENHNTLLLDAGDVFQGTPYFNLFGGQLEFTLMSRMKYDAMTLGNHEFDNGLTHLGTQMKHASFPFVCSNYHFSNTPLQNKTIPWLIVNKGPFRVGIIGLGIDPKGLISNGNWAGMQWSDPIETGEKNALMLRKEKGCNLIVALSHLGIETNSPEKASDMHLAKESTAIDVIIGGHTHTFLDTPRLVTNKINKKVLVNQMGWGGVRLGRIDLSIKGGHIAHKGTNYPLA